VATGRSNAISSSVMTTFPAARALDHDAASGPADCCVTPAGFCITRSTAFVTTIVTSTASTAPDTMRASMPVTARRTNADACAISTFACAVSVGDRGRHRTATSLLLASGAAM